jgi:hypothetical protein
VLYDSEDAARSFMAEVADAAAPNLIVGPQV